MVLILRLSFKLEGKCASLNFNVRLKTFPWTSFECFVWNTSGKSDWMFPLSASRSLMLLSLVLLFLKATEERLSLLCIFARTRRVQEVDLLTLNVALHDEIRAWVMTRHSVVPLTLQQRFSDTLNVDNWVSWDAFYPQCLSNDAVHVSHVIINSDKRILRLF